MGKIAIILISMTFLGACAHKYGSACGGSEKTACTDTACKEACTSKDACTAHEQKCTHCMDKAK